MSITILPIVGLPLIVANDDLAQLLSDQFSHSKPPIQDQDVLVVAQKIVSKAEGRSVLLDAVSPSSAAIKLAHEVEKDSRVVELILQESTEIVRKKKGVLITRHRLGHVCANAGIDQSNISHEGGERALLLPLDPDKSARRIQSHILCKTRANIAVIVSDSVNRPWRLGSSSIAIGIANCNVLEDHRGECDLYGRTLQLTMINRGDSIATAANLVMGETKESIPAAIVRGLASAFPIDTSATVSHRPLNEDLFR